MGTSFWTSPYAPAPRFFWFKLWLFKGQSIPCWTCILHILHLNGTLSLVVFWKVHVLWSRWAFCILHALNVFCPFHVCFFCCYHVQTLLAFLSSWGCCPLSSSQGSAHQWAQSSLFHRKKILCHVRNMVNNTKWSSWNLVAIYASSMCFIGCCELLTVITTQFPSCCHILINFFSSPIMWLFQTGVCNPILCLVNYCTFSRCGTL